MVEGVKAELPLAVRLHGEEPHVKRGAAERPHERRIRGDHDFIGVAIEGQVLQAMPGARGRVLEDQVVKYPTASLAYGYSRMPATFTPSV